MTTSDSLALSKGSDYLPLATSSQALREVAQGMDEKISQLFMDVHALSMYQSPTSSMIHLFHELFRDHASMIRILSRWNNELRNALDENPWNLPEVRQMMLDNAPVDSGLRFLVIFKTLETTILDAWKQFASSESSTGEQIERGRQAFISALTVLRIALSSDVTTVSSRIRDRSKQVGAILSNS